MNVWMYELWILWIIIYLWIYLWINECKMYEYMHAWKRIYESMNMWTYNTWMYECMNYEYYESLYLWIHLWVHECKMYEYTCMHVIKTMIPWICGHMNKWVHVYMICLRQGVSPLLHPLLNNYSLLLSYFQTKLITTIFIIKIICNNH